jgi:flagellar basal-body rod modification protein FlgD
MEPVLGVANPTSIAQGPDALAGMGTQDFLNLLVTQLTHQDPLEPTGNEELMRQISSIREIELSTTLTESLRALSGQQNFGSASSLIGQYVTGLPQPDGAVPRGLVVGVRFDEGRQIMLLLADGTELRMDRVSAIESPQRAAESLIGLKVAGFDRRGAGERELVEGVVTATRVGDAGQVVLELDTGHDLRLMDVSTVTEAVAA